MAGAEDFVWFLRVVYLWIADSIKALLPYDLLPQKSLRGQLALVTGGAGGIGRFLALELGKRGAEVVLWDIQKEALKEAVEWLKEEGGIVAHSDVVDLTKKEEIYRAAARLKKQHGELDLLFNNAGASTGYSFEEPDDERLESCIRINLLSHFYTLRAFLPAMIKRNHGHVIATASSWALLADGSFPDYSAAKTGVVGLMRSLRLELAREGVDGIKTTLMFPTYVSTPLCQGYVHNSIVLSQLEPALVARRTLEAVVVDQEEVLIPRAFYWVNFLHKIAPARVADELASFVTGRDVLDYFVRKGLVPERKPLRDLAEVEVPASF